MHLLRTAVLLAVACLASAKPAHLAPTPVFPPPYITVVKESRSYPNDGAFSSYFEASNGIAVALQGSKRINGGGAVIRGNYSYLQDDGSQAAVTFVADENGYQPSSDLLPVGPPMPAHSLLQIERARLQGSSDSSEEISLSYSAPKTTEAPRTYTTTSQPRSYTSTTTEEPPRYTPPPTTTTQRPRSYTRRAYTTTTTEEPSSPAEDSSEEVVLPTTTTTTTTPAPIRRTYGVPEEDSTEDESTTTQLPLVYTIPDDDSSEEISVSVPEAPLLYTPPKESSVEDDSEQEVIVTTPAALAYSPPEALDSVEESEEGEITTTTTEPPLRYTPPEEVQSEEDSAEEQIVTATELPLRYTPPVETASKEDSAEEESAPATELPLRYTPPVETASEEESAEEETVPATELPLRYTPPVETASEEDSAEEESAPATELPLRYTPPVETASEEDSAEGEIAPATELPLRYTPPVEAASEENSAEDIATATELSLPLVYNPPQELVSVEDVSEELPVTTALPNLSLEGEASSEEITTSTTTTTTAATQRPFRYFRYSRLGYKEASSEEVLATTTKTTTTKPSTTARRSYTKPYWLRKITTPQPFRYVAPTLYFPQVVESSESSLLTTDDSQETVQDELQETLADDKSEETLVAVTQESEVAIGSDIEENDDTSSATALGANTVQNTFTVVQGEEDSLDNSSEQTVTVDNVKSEAETSPVSQFTVILDDDQVDSIETNVSLEETVSSEDVSFKSTLKVLADDSHETLVQIDTVDPISNLQEQQISKEPVADVAEISFKTLEDVFQEIGGVVQSLASRELSDEVLITELPAVAPLPTDTVNVPESRFVIVHSSEDLSLDLTSNESLSSFETATESAEEVNSNENNSERLSETSNETLEKLSFDDGTILDISSEEIGLSLTAEAATVAVDNTKPAPSKTLADVFAEINSAVDSLKSQESLEVLATPAASGSSTPQFTVVQSNENLSVDLLSGKPLFSSEELSLGLTQALITSELAAVVNKTSEVVAAPAVVESAAAADTVSDEIKVEITTEAASDEDLAVFVSVSNEFEKGKVTTDAASDEILGELSVVSSEASSAELQSEQVHVPSLQATVDDDTTETTDGPPSVEQLVSAYQYNAPS